MRLKYGRGVCGRAAAACAAIAGLWVMTANPVVEAQGSVTITSPAANAKLAAGPDYATDVLGDPWDMSNQEDIAIDPAQKTFWTSMSVNAGGNGLFTGTTAATSGVNLALLQRAYYTIINPGRTGQRYPIDSSRFTKLAFKMSASQGGQFPQIYWSHHDVGDPADSGGWRYAPENGLPYSAGTRIVVLDMTQFNQFNPWTNGAVKGFSLHPNSTNVANDVQYDWVRLTTGDNNSDAKKVNIAWNGGSGNIDINVTETASGISYKVATVAASSGSFLWNYGVLPPGSYTLNVGGTTRNFSVNAPPSIQVIDPDETGGEDFATTVLGNPWDMADTGDFVQNVNIVDHLISRTVGASGFVGRSDGQTVAFTDDGIPVGDPQVYFFSKGKDSETTVIDTHRYHRLTYGLQVHRAFDLGRGSVARVFWGSQSSTTGGGTPYNVTTSKDIIVWEGMNGYTVDLATLTTGPTGGLETANATPWTAQNVRHLRIDPFEFAEQITFQYPSVKLAADDETVNGQFTIRFAGSDPNQDPSTVALYYDTDQNALNGLTLITSGLPLSQAGQFVWNTSGVPPGTYYIFAVASDGLNPMGRYSTGPIKVVSFTSPSNPVMSVDGPANGSSGPRPFTISGWAIDTAAPSGTGVDSVVVYADPGTASEQFLGAATYGAARGDIGAAFGARFTNSGFSLTVTSLAAGTHTLGVYARSTVTGTYNNVKVVTFTVLAGASVPGADFDGDSKSDITVYNTSNGVWSTLKSNSGYTTAMNIGWGGTGYTPAPGDYDGDGKADLAIYQQSSGNWYVLLSSSGFTTSLSKNVGGSGWTAVPGDYDGDHKTDLVVYNTSTGQWYGLKSSTNYTTSLSVGWGGTGYTAAPGDFDGDGKIDPTVYQQSSGTWYALLSSGNYTTTLSKGAGGSGYVPVQGDYDGDGKADFAVYNTSTGLWFALKSGSNYTTTLTVNWGGSGYTPARGDFDGDGKLDLALYQGSSGNWYILLSGAGYTTTISKSWGGSGYIPVPAFP